MFRMMRQQARAEKVRLGWKAQGIHVPPFAIASITNHCNLHCIGCYARAHHRSPEAEMAADELRSMIAEADELGMSIMLLAGGEPLTRPELLDITRDHPGIAFLLFTNGLLINEAMISRFRVQRHVVPVISLEGREPFTDDRRGQGVYRHLQKTIAKMKERRIFFGTSLTVTRRNFATVMDEDFIRELIAKGCRLIFFIDYVPVEEGTGNLVLTEEQSAEEARLIKLFLSKFPALFVAFPGGEDMFGGCLAAGRGFVHISAGGRLEPCPFSPFSDSSLKDMSLKEALQSELLRAIRESDAHLSEIGGGCALWENREWVASLLEPEQSELSLAEPANCLDSP